MTLTFKEAWTAFHGMVLGGTFLLAFTGVLVALYNMRPDLVVAGSLPTRVRQLNVGTWLMAGVIWLTVISGTFLVYPWYSSSPPEGVEITQAYPKAYLKADPALKPWHSFGMEWKEHVAWISPFLATAVAYIVWRYGTQLATEEQLRKIISTIFILSFLIVGIAALLGALITKTAPVV